jgi:hypothetical protein
LSKIEDQFPNEVIPGAKHPLIQLFAGLVKMISGAAAKYFSLWKQKRNTYEI